MTDEELRDSYTIPITSSWFKWKEIHETERRWFPEFFEKGSFSKNPRIYKEYRDFLINKFREDPSRRLTFTQARKSLICDVGSLSKIFNFLEKWGLINFRVKDKGETNGMDGVRVVVEEGPPVGVKVVGAASRTAVGSNGGGESGFRLPALTSYNDVFGEWVVGKGDLCAGCGVGGRKCESTESGYAVCSNCLEKKNNKKEESAGDLKTDNHVDQSGNDLTVVWTDAETLLLLEAVLKHGDDWDLIAQHVRTKSKLDCIARLIHLPFGEHMLGASSRKLDNRISSNEATKLKPAHHVLKEQSDELTKTDAEEPIKSDVEQQTNTYEKDKAADVSTAERPLKRRCFPSFVGNTDSLMKQVASLSTVVGPHIAAAAAKAAVTALCRENPCAKGAFKIDEDGVTYKFGRSKAKDGPESDQKFEDWDPIRNKQTDQEEPILEKNFGAMTFQIRAAIATAIGATAARAKLLADQEEREMELLLASIIQTQLKKIQIKMKLLEEVELIMEKEYTEIQKLKESIIHDWERVLREAVNSGIQNWRDHGFPKSVLNTVV